MADLKRGSCSPVYWLFLSTLVEGSTPSPRLPQYFLSISVGLTAFSQTLSDGLCFSLVEG